MPQDKATSVYYEHITVDLERLGYIGRVIAETARRNDNIRTVFQFPFCHKRSTFGDANFEQWWISQRGLYGERGFTSPAHREIVDSFWTVCLEEGSAFTDRGVQESYILAHLLPDARSNGSRRVFVDASLTRPNYKGRLDRSKDLENLEHMLQASKQNEIDLLDFNRRTGDSLGPPVYDEQTINRYEELSSEILDDACNELSTSGLSGLESAIDRWAKRMKQFGRRSGHPIEKNVLDILSYDCRAAFHRCYSTAWFFLLDTLAECKELSADAILFHRLWHQDQCFPAEQGDDGRFHTFHGHIFGLHPAAANLVCTPTGASLLGDLISAPTDISAQRRFLYGLFVAVVEYANCYDVSKELRKEQTHLCYVSDPEEVQAQQTARKRGRRSGGR